ncbi:MAG TPA: ABC transporter permease, partial [Nevskiaceae bacterium]|nr:ABC transporter permease [Nevskiaceae bacterium]
MRTIFAITLMNLRSIPARLGSSLVIVVGIAFVVAVLVSMLSMSRGFDRTLRGTGNDGRVLFLSTGVLAELSSYITPDILPLVEGLPGLATDAAGRPLVSPELVVITELRKGDGPKAASVNVALRGIGAAG